MDAVKRTHLLASGVLISTAALLTGLLGRVGWIERAMCRRIVAERLRQAAIRL